jgi:isoleucyl-tRNA synthetase
MHKSLGNVIDPMDVLKEHGADILRLFFASVEFKNDVRIGKEALTPVIESYRKIRNTFRYFLANLYDFDKNDILSFENLNLIDKWSILNLEKIINKIKNNYDKYEFQLVYSILNKFIVNDMSNFYIDILKDRLYTSVPNSKDRRSAQTVFYTTLISLASVIYPILSFTAEEIYQSIPEKLKNEKSIALLDWPVFPYIKETKINNMIINYVDNIIEIRKTLKKLLENLKNKNIVKKLIETDLILFVENPSNLFIFDNYNKNELEEMLSVSNIFITKKEEFQNIINNYNKNEIEYSSLTVNNEKVYLVLAKTKASACSRCFKSFYNLESNDLCQKCINVINKLVSK